MFTAALQSGSGSNPTATIAFVADIQHVVLIVQENRTPDNLFSNGGSGPLPGADVDVSSGVNSQGETVALQPEGLVTNYDLGHFHAAFELECNATNATSGTQAYQNGCAMNGWDLEGFVCQGTGTEQGCIPPPQPEFGYVPRSQIQPYWTMAETYGFADRMFQTNEGPSYPAHMYLFQGNSAIDNTNTIYVMDNPVSPTGTGAPAGCDAPSGTLVSLINPFTNAQTQDAYPCFDHVTLTDLMDAKHVSWKYYQPKITTKTNGAGLWYSPDAIQHIRYGADYANVSTPNTAILNDITNGTLPNFSWVIPTAAESDHAGENDGNGPNWVAEVVNAVGNSKYWDNTVIFVVWDDWGGWYDHVQPGAQYPGAGPANGIRNYYELGFRVPLIVISPFAKPGYVSHVQHEFGSILRFTEETFALGNLGQTDALSTTDDLSDMFDFNQAPLIYSTIPAPAVSPSAIMDTRAPDND